MSRVFVALLATVLLAGCDGLSLQFGGLDTAALEEQILADVDAQFDVEFEEVTCPDGVEPRVGDVFVCRVRAVDGSVGVVEVRQLEPGDPACGEDQGAGGDVCVTWELTEVLAPGEED